MTFVRSTLALMLGAFACTVAQAGVIRVAPPSQTIEVGTPFMVSVFFDETNGDVTAAGGLISAGARLFVQSSLAPSLSLGAVTLNNQFSATQLVYPTDGGFPQPDPPLGLANLVGFYMETDFADPNVFPDASGSILMAEIELTATSGDPGTVFDFVPSILGIPPGEEPGFVAIVGLDDNLNETNFDATATTQGGEARIPGVVPEPGSILIWAGMVGAPLLVRKRRRQAKK